MYWLRYLLKEPFNALRTSTNREFMGLLLKYGNSRRHTRTEVEFGAFRLTVPDTMSFLWQHKEIFADEFYYFESKNPAPVIFDCGANVGMSVLYFKKLFPKARITAFEAEPDIAALLLNNLKNSNIQDVRIIDKAVWKDDQGIWFGSESADSSSIYSNAKKKKIGSIRLKDFLLAENHIDFLKIDIEGAEKEVLNDCRDALSHVQNLFVEFHSYIGNPQGLAEIIQIFEENGFRYYIDTNQHRLKPFTNYRYRGNDVMDLQLNIFGWRE
ncbi:FkbM family methyltransferase [Dyadobacter chenwenxiniae]|uniref:FkbM family methyltransferase n=1 Tax=Dyadobacter chenwenxiniae TaxID=2906456 RepID=A0A9X1PHX0_9BACT|nr:FkbM family methyltransferase [Dyadobacter chenwenxiniae]MCF0061103.1 FkbM family methyltransferase [Dyadobacter chenwenxiniae]UON80930.1 FkbM family methyltransferase [Dyadobacter chenwenxiniae]